MQSVKIVKKFLGCESGAITVDWTVISSAAVGLALATTAILTDVVDVLVSRMDDELRSSTLNDEFVRFVGQHFEPFLAAGFITESEAETYYNAANEMLNYDVMADLVAGITAMEEGTITPEELVELVAIASVAHQRNLVNDATLDYYFGFGGSTPYYVTNGDQPTNTL